MDHICWVDWARMDSHCDLLQGYSIILNQSFEILSFSSLLIFWQGFHRLMTYRIDCLLLLLCAISLQGFSTTWSTSQVVLYSLSESDAYDSIVPSTILWSLGFHSHSYSYWLCFPNLLPWSYHFICRWSMYLDLCPLEVKVIMMT